MKKRVVVTGASGFVGQRLIEELITQSYRVVAVTRNMDALSRYSEHPAVEILAWNGQVNSLKSTIDSAVSLCHLAAYIPSDLHTSAEAEKCLKINALLTLELAEIAADCNVRFIYPSSVHLYPAQRATYYLTSKLAGELYVEHLRQTQNLNAVVFRVGACYGPGMTTKSAILVFLKTAMEGGTITIFNGGKLKQDFVHVSDIVKLIVAAIETGEPGVYNAGSGELSSVLELAQTVVSIFPETSPKIIMHDEDAPELADIRPLSIEATTRTWGYNPRVLTAGLIDFKHALLKLS